MALFVQSADTGIWHWCQICSQYPATDNYAGRRFDSPGTGRGEEGAARDREGRCGSQQESVR